MKRVSIIKFLTIATILLAVSSCKQTWIMYDDSQRDHLYFDKLDTTSINNVSLVFVPEDELNYEIPIKLMGMPRPFDRNITVAFRDDTLKTYTSGGITYEVQQGQRGIDYELVSAVIPAGKIGGKIIISVKRQKIMREKMVEVFFEIKDDASFISKKGDFSRFVISDGDVPCPSFWTTTYQNINHEWVMYLGTFNQHKYSMFMDLYHEMATTNPAFYQTQVDKYGEYFEKKVDYNDGKGPSDIKASFFATENSTIWAGYVLVPMFNYFKENAPDAEIYTNDAASVTNKAWKNPVNLYR